MSALHAVIVPPGHRNGPVIGCRWTPHYREHTDRSTGFYECVNTLMDGSVELATQAALLLRVSPRVERRIAAIRQLRSST